jgi:D-glutamate N-acetyltransferase
MHLPGGCGLNDSVIEFQVPYAVFFGDADEENYCKTGLGLVQWRRESCAGQLRLPGCRVDAGVTDLSVSQAKAAGVRSLILGSAAVGGGIPPHWVATLCQAASVGIDIVAGLHVRLASLTNLAEAAAAGGARLIDVRIPPVGLPVGTGRKRSGLRLLTVGTDCSIGKKYTALALAREMQARAMKSDFRASGQTGIMIAGRGVPMDAVVADFVTGAAELLSPDNDADHWDVIEGQGSIFHPGFLQVATGLLVGSQPDAFVVCHDPLRKAISGWPSFSLPSVSEVIERTIAVGRLTNPAIRCVGVALNTSKVPQATRVSRLQQYAGELALPCVDPLIEGVGPIVERLLQEFS